MLELKNICKSFNQGEFKNSVLKDINLIVKQGDFISIMGPSGSGKSTLINILGLLDSEFRGEYKLNGEIIKSLNEDQHATLRNNDIGFVFQQFHLIDEYTVRENILLSFLYSEKKANLKYIESLVEDLGLVDKLNEYPNNLSGGQKQRVALIRALAHKPKFLIADEPTGALDEESRDEILQILQNLNNSGTTIIIVTHDEFVANCSKTRYKMRNGHLTLEGLKLNEV
ncbi:MAG: ABC transporter ATP-binding protein [Streptococcus parasanguinis]|uniref:ABC transporter ATP-binding protein n=1 Tax=Streptococcus parasanguinis TaxID=1318 RepID=UPI00021BCD17|nr:ABC transporter ATP-binding protein [Streptococcus parasanguinis]EGU62681.1 ABC transporter, ATP-binding protein [Streptococcus parasanguinis SK236]MDU6758223.1 ABC transporter ATP-binding protein [Streptococcus parasanguinis]